MEGEVGREDWDSNPGTGCPVNGFQGRPDVDRSRPVDAVRVTFAQVGGRVVGQRHDGMPSTWEGISPPFSLRLASALRRSAVVMERHDAAC
jgi:hypothetical protein